MSLQKRVFDVLEVQPDDPFSEKVFNFLMMCLIALNMAAIILETDQDIATEYESLFNYFEALSVAIFSIEYLLRLWTCTIRERFRQPIAGRLRYLVTPEALIDIAAILPFFVLLLVPLDLRFVRAIRLLRLLRLFKLGRYSDSLRTFGNVLVAKKEDLGIAAMLAALLLVVASTLMYFAEHEAQPNSFSSIVASMWWGAVTLTTVGYGDIYPVTPLGKIFGALIALSGIGMFALPAGILASGFSEEIQRRQQEAIICPHCGKDIADSPDVLHREEQPVESRR